MVDFVNKIELSDQIYYTNGNVIDEKYKGKLLFPIKDFVSFGTYRQSIYFMSTRFLKDEINGVYVTQFQLDYIHDKTHISHRKMVNLCHEVPYMWWVNQYLKLQEWEYFINLNKK